MILPGNALSHHHQQSVSQTRKSQKKKNQKKLHEEKERKSKNDDAPNISPPMPFNLRDIRQPSNRKAEKLPIERTRDAFPDGGLPDTRRAHKANDLPLHRSAQLAHREELEDPVLDVFQPVVVFV